MAKKNYYAWLAPEGWGIFKTWAECEAACRGIRGEHHKGFATYEEAWQFTHPDEPDSRPADNNPADEPVAVKKADKDTETEASRPTSAYLPFADTVIPITDEVNRYCEKYGFDKLSDKQRMAVQSVDGKTLLFSVPGSGKTTVIIARTGFMVYSRKIIPGNIISLSFTKAAANEMAARYKDHFKTENTPDFRTIHSLCYSVVLPMLRKAGYSHPEHLLGIEEGEEDEEKPRNPTAVYKLLFKQIHHPTTDFETAMEATQTVITGIKNSVMRPEEYENKTLKIDGVDVSIALLFNTYQQIMQDLDCMDFDDLLKYAYNGLKKSPAVLQKLRKKYTYWSVDEAQDTSKLQFKLLDLMCGADGNMFMVGDDDQSIYSFRGADPALLLSFGRRNGVVPLGMGYNYRSDSDIVSASKSFIESNKNRAEKAMKAYSSLPGEIHIPQAFRTEAGQYEFIVQAAKAAVTNNETLAVLYRRNVSVFPLIVYFHKNGIPYEANKGTAEILRSKDIKKIWKIFRFLAAPNSYAAFSSCRTALNLFLNDKELENLKKEHAKNSRTPVLEVLRRKYEENDNPEKAADIRELIKTLSEIREMRPTDAANAVLSKLLLWYSESINEKLRIYSFLSACDLFDSVGGFVDTINDIISEEKKKATTPDPTDFDNSLATVTTSRKPVVTLSSMHSAKGREFDRVIIVDTFDDIMPGQERDDALIYDPEEERRLFYVAVTRAAHRLDLLTVDKYHGNPEKISRFIREFAYICDQIAVGANVSENIPESNPVPSGTIRIEPAKYYAVKVGFKPGIYTTWSECSCQVNGFPGAEYKSFTTREEAEAYLGIEFAQLPQPTSLKTIEPKIVAADGVAFNYPMDLPADVNEAVYKYLGVSSLDKLDPETQEKLRRHGNNMYSTGKIVDYHFAAEAYLLTYMPVNFYKIWKPLYDLACADELPRTCRALELGAGPGTSTMSLISFYSELAVSNPRITFSLDITAVEKEASFQPIFESLTERRSNSCPPNLRVTSSFILGDALEKQTEYEREYNLVFESNMLNSAEGMGVQSIGNFAKILSKTLNDNGAVILIEPGTKEDEAFLKRIESIASREKTAEPFVQSKKAAVIISEITLYREAVSIGLRSGGIDRHWFSYLVMKRGGIPL